MAEETKKPVPLIRRSLPMRVVKGVAVALGVVFLSVVIFLTWAFKTGRAVEATRQQILTELHQRCEVDAKFETIALDPIEQEILLTKLEMRHLDGRKILAVEEAIVSVELLPLFIRRLQLDRVALLAPEATIELREGTILNLPKCVQPPEKPATDEPVTPIVLGISELAVERGRFNLVIDDKLEATLGDIGITLRPGESGGTNIAVGVDDGMISTSGKKLELRRFRMLAHLEGLLTRPRALVLDNLDVGLAQLEVSGQGSIDLLGPVYEAKLHVLAPLEAVHDFVEGAPEVAGDLELEVSLAGTAATPRGSGKVVVTNGAVDAYSLGDRTTIELAVDQEGADIRSFEVVVGDGGVSGSARVAFDDKLTTTVETHANQLSFGRLLDMVDVDHAWINYFATGKAAFTGSLKPFVLSGDFDYALTNLIVYDRAWDAPEVRGRTAGELLPSQVMLGIPAIRARGKWTYDPEGISFSEALIESGSTVAHADARVNFREAAGFRVVTQMPSFDFGDIGPIAGLHFGGRGTLSASLGGPYDDVRAQGMTDLEGVTVAGIPFGRASTNIDWVNITTLQLSNINGRLGKSTYRGDVRVELEGEFPLSIAGVIDKGRIEDALVPFGVDAREWGDASGDLTGTFDLTGPVDRLTGPIELDLGPSMVVGEEAEQGKVMARLELGRVIVDALEIEKHGAKISGSGMYDPKRGDVEARVRTNGGTLQALDVLRTSQPRLDGTLALELELGGHLNGVTGTVTATIDDLRAGPLALSGGTLHGRLRGATLSVEGSLLGRALEVDGEITAARGLPYKAALDIKQLDAPRIMGGLDGHLRYKGLVTGRAEVHGSLVDWHLSDGKLSLDRGRLETPSFSIETAAPTHFTMRRGVLETTRFALVGPRTRVSGQGKLGARVLDLRVNGRLDLGIVELLSPSVERAAGTLTVDSAIAGSFSDMSLVGKGRIEGGILQWRGFERLTAVTADLTFSQSTVLIDRSRGQWAGGRLSVTGNVLMEAFKPKTLSLTVTADAVHPKLTYPRFDLSGLLSGNVQVEGTPKRLQVSGNLDVEKSRIVPKFDLSTLVSSKRASEAYDPSQEILSFDVALHAREPMRIRNDRIDVELAGDVRFTGTNERWGLLGAVTVLKGGRAFFGREYEVEAGTIEMRERFRFVPRYDLLLNATACQSRIRINMVGTLERDPEFSFTSNPDMDSEDIRSCLVLGVKRNLEADPTTFAADALLKVAGVDREVKKVLPIDQIGLSTEYSSQARGTVPRVNVAKEILDGRVRLEYSSSLVDTSDQRAAVRWQLSRKLTLQGGWTSSANVPLGDFGVDLKQRWEW